MPKTFKQFEEYDNICDEVIFEHENFIQERIPRSKKVKLNDPIRISSPKKFYVYVKDGDKVKKVSFNDTTNLSIKRDDPTKKKVI